MEPLENRCLLSATLWTQRGGNAGHTSYVDVDVNAAAIAQAWNQPLNYSSSGIGSWWERAVAIDETRVYRTDLEGYAPSGTYHVMAFDLQTGMLDWNQAITGRAFEGVGEPSVANGIVYVNRAGHSGISGGTSSDLPRLYGLNAETGATVVQTTYSAQWAANERPVIADNQLLAYDGYYGGFSVWSASTLSKEWHVDNTNNMWSSTAAMDDQYVYAYNNRVYLRSNGARQADIAVPAGIFLRDVIVSDSGRVLISMSGSVGGVTKYGLSAYDGDTHALLWTAYTDSSVAAKAVGNGIVAVAAGQQLILVDETSGAQIGAWQAPFNLSSEIVLTRTHVFVESSTNGLVRVHAINLETRQEEWTFQNTLGGELGSPLMEMAFGGGHLLLSNDAFVRAFNVPEGNRNPNAVDDNGTTDENTPLTMNVLVNDSDPDGDDLTVTAIGAPAHGQAVFSAGGTITYTPNDNYHGTDSFTYSISDGKGGDDTATVNITVNSVQTPPIAVNDLYLVDEDMPLNVIGPGVLGNDSDADGDPLIATLETGPANGTLELQSDGSFTYLPNSNFNGSDSFTYRVNDGSDDSNIATVTITINAVNDPPIANDDAAVTNEDTPVMIDVAANDTDADGSLDPDTAVVVSGPTHGVVTNNGDGTFAYAPDRNYYGSDSFTYRVNDGSDDSNIATVHITINSVRNLVIDVKPGNDDKVNPINLKSKGRTPIAILATQTAAGEIDDFDPTKIDLSTIAFQINGKSIVPVKMTLEDVDKDGDLDLLLHFSTQDLANILTPSSVDLVLTAEFGDALESKVTGFAAIGSVPRKEKTR